LSVYPTAAFVPPYLITYLLARSVGGRVTLLYPLSVTEETFFMHARKLW